MPLEGRDYTVKVRTNDNGKLTVVIAGITPEGKAFADHCVKNLAAELAKTKG